MSTVPLQNYQSRLEQHLARYKIETLKILDPGIFRYRGVELEKGHILPEAQRDSNLLKAARPLVSDYMNRRPALKWHRYAYHLNSSQAFAFNLFVPFFQGEQQGSTSLLNALGQRQRSRLINWDPEWIFNREEKTNIDVTWVLEDGTRGICEVKLSEREFGQAKKDESHLRKLKNTYAPVLSSCVEPEVLEPASFFKDYQFWRNVWHLTQIEKSRLVFLLPRENKPLWGRIDPLLKRMSSELRERIDIVAVEDVVNRLLEDSSCPELLREHTRELHAKYII